MVDQSVVMVVLIMLFMMMAVVVVYAFGYKKVPPNKALVVLGRRGRAGDGRNVLSGGGKFILPGLESYRILDLSADLVTFELTGVNTTSQEGPVTMRIQVAAIWKIATDKESLGSHANSLVERTHGENEMAVRETLERAIRDMAASATLEAVESDRNWMASKVQRSAVELIDQHGLEIRSLVLLDVRPQG